MKARSFVVEKGLKYKYLISFSSPIHLILSGIIAGALTFLSMYFLLIIISAIEFKKSEFFISLIVSSIGGGIASLVKYVDQKLEILSYKETTIKDIIANITYYFFLISVLVYSLTALYEAWKEKTTITEPSVLITALIMFSFIASFIIYHLWDFFFKGIISLISPVDWMLKADEDAFKRVLSLKFEEAKRYSTPLTLLLIKPYIESGSPKDLKKFIITLESEVIDSLRRVDLVARIEGGKYLAVLMSVNKAQAKVPAARIKKLADEVLDRLKISGGVDISASSFSPEITSEEEMVRVAKDLMGSFEF